MMIYRRDRYGRGGDHIPFLERGYPAVRFTEVNEEFRHQHQNVRVENGVQFGDLPEFVDFGYVANVARVNAASLAALAWAPGRPKGVTIVAQRLSNDTELRWEANKEPDLAGYEIVWRETTDAEWTNSKPVGNVTTFTMKGMSKDNYFFGIRSIDKDGNKSPVSYPRPQTRNP
jgi:Fibronectin type III domain